jgi:cytochrome c
MRPEDGAGDDVAGTGVFAMTCDWCGEETGRVRKTYQDGDLVLCPECWGDYQEARAPKLDGEPTSPSRPA